MLSDINDFDETLPGPWEWDLSGSRPASRSCRPRSRVQARPTGASMVLTAAQGVPPAHRPRGPASGTLAVLVRRPRRPAPLVRILEQGSGGGPPHGKAAAAHDAQPAPRPRTRDSAHVYAKRTAEVGGEPRIVADPPLIVPAEDLHRARVGLGLHRADAGRGDERVPRHARPPAPPFEEFRYVHAARKVVGVGSVGTRCFILLFLGRDARRPVVPAGPRKLDRPCLSGSWAKSTSASNGERVVHRAAADAGRERHLPGLGDSPPAWTGRPRDFYVRQFQDWKGKRRRDSLRVPGAHAYARICGATLARAHARSGDRIAIASYLGQSDGVRHRDRGLLGRLR